MGKIKIRTLGTELEEQEKEKQKKKHQVKKSVRVPGMKGGERVVAVGPTEEEMARLSSEENKKTATTEPQKKTEALKKKKVRPQRMRSKRYQAVASLVDRNKTYGLSEALELLEKMKRIQDETVELHINTLSTGISETTTLPHGTHKKTRVAVASDTLISEVEKGIVAFDVLLADPQMMPKLAKVARILGPKGLMPNPKAGTVTSNPESLAKKFEAGQLRIKTEAKAPIIHVSVGKVSFGKEKLSDNIDAVLTAVKKENIKKVVLKSTMSPAIKVNI